MYEKVRAYITENQMIPPGSMVLAGVSGGGDSMTMLSMLRRYAEEADISLHVVHVHHGIRGDEADRDSRFVLEICGQWGIPCQIYRYPVPELAQKWKMGHEEAGRLVRKEAFQEEIRRLEASEGEVRIALAHNQNDLAETMIHNLARGTGLRGLCSMRPVSEEIIRPVMCLERSEITRYLKEQEIPFIQDSSNLSDDYTRNRIRRHILPLMEAEVNSKAAAHLAETSRMIAQAEDYLNRQGLALLESCEKSEKEYVFSRDFFRKEPVIQAYAILSGFERLAGRRKDFTALHVRQLQKLMESQTGRSISFPYGLRARRTYEGVLLEKQDMIPASDPAMEEWQLLLPGVLSCPFGTFTAKIFPYNGQKIEEKMYTKWFDYDRINCSLCIRTRKTGDYLIVNREGNRKKLNRFMIDARIPQEERDKIPLAVCDREVLWIVGVRISEGYKITPETRRVLELKYQGGKII